MNPFELSRQIEERYRDYLQTTFYFKDPELRASFAAALDSGHLAKGPYLEATPVFIRGVSPQQLFPELLGFQPEDGFIRALHGNRPLYKHQELAVRGSNAGCNIVVATGTGSGKTESFLYPILLHLYKEFQAGQLSPGVRALILYPMNALVNDQRERLGDICRRLQKEQASFKFTFGQYVGETPKDASDTYRNARARLQERSDSGFTEIVDGEVRHGEMVLRSEMRASPPHILLTNYSMLEYLLLRPDDSPLFDHGNAQWWTFLVLDEAHQYRGSQGMEMAMLLRRLKRRLHEGGRSDPFRCIATSATLVDGEGGKGTVAEFAAALFGEEYAENDIILGETQPIPVPGSKSLGCEDYRLLKRLVTAPSNHSALSQLQTVAARLDVSLASEETLASLTGLLQHDRRSAELRRLIARNPAPVQEVADRIFFDSPVEQRVSALTDLAELLLTAKDDSGASLMTARYHLFVRSLEGGFVSFWPNRGIFLDRRTQSEDGTVFEVALCRECGQHYIVGKISGGRLVEAIRDPSRDDFGADFYLPLDEDEGEVSTTRYQLCVECGAIWRANQPSTCGHTRRIQVEKQDAASGNIDQVTRCGACGHRSDDPVREVIYGTDGPHAVIATTLYRNLPPERRKLLAFADGRQEAAFFAWYLENSYKSILHRNLLLRAVTRLSAIVPEGLSLEDAASDLRQLYREHGVFPESHSGLTLAREAWLSLYRELLTEQQRNSLEGVGAIQWFIEWPSWFGPVNYFAAEPWNLTEQEIWSLMLLLLNSMRTDGAVDLRAPPGVALTWSDLGIQRPQTGLVIGPPQNNARLKSWDGAGGRRAEFLSRMLERKGRSKAEAKALVVDALREAWEAFRQLEVTAPSPQRMLGSADGAVRLNPNWLRVRLNQSTDTIFICDTCSRLYPVSVQDVCPRHRCPGTLVPTALSELEPDHYFRLYKETLPGSMRVEEHTAQLDSEKAREFQRDFRNNAINVLSCSTTFELGVDLGDLDTVFLRNVPPEAFNYAQRVGRAGRRSDFPGFTVTYCRRAPHDLYHFSEPERMLSGHIRAPSLHLTNDKIITRHVTAVALSSFFRAQSERFENVQALFGDLAEPNGVTTLKGFIQENRSALETSLSAIVPKDSARTIGLHDGCWIERIAGEDSRFALAEIEVSSDFTAIHELEETAARERNPGLLRWAQARLRTIVSEDVLSLLSRKAVIPKYGFPVDVAELDIQSAFRTADSTGVSLQRDLSIAVAEFAPTSTLVANKKLWTSYGLKRVAEKEWGRWWYGRCQMHNTFVRGRTREEVQTAQCCPRMVPKEYIDPLFGFTTNRDAPKEPKRRPPKVFTTRPHFAGFTDAEGAPIDMGVAALKKATPAYMVVLCEGKRGQGFYICPRCGAGLPNRRAAPHKTPYDKDCSMTALVPAVALGHEFITDVLQLDFRVSPNEEVEASVWFAYSLAYALVEGAAEVLQVPSGDLNTTVAAVREYVLPPIILYDNVPGGAGLVARLEAQEEFVKCLKAALRRVGGKCGCEEATSCYGCLRSYRNQFAHHQLMRGPVKKYLEQLLEV